MIKVSLCYRCEKVFILMNIWMIGKNLMKHFYSYLNMEKIVCKDFETKKLGEYHDLYVQSNTLLLADVFQNFRNMSLKLYELDPAKFLSVPGLAWLAALKNTKLKLDLLTDIDMLLEVEKGIRWRKISLYLSICES